ncbi:hypothetical protein JCM8208_003931 [Rhodotorula glutinis]
MLDAASPDTAARSTLAMHHHPASSPAAPDASGPSALPLAAIQHAVHAQLPQSLVRSRISSSPTLLPTHLAQLVTALSLCARVSLRASALFIEAIVEGLQCGTVTGLGLTRRALIAAVGSARAMHHVKEGLDWSGRDKDGGKSEDAFLQVLDKYTNLGIYLIHHTFTLAELFTMSGFYLTLNTISTGFSAAEESVRMLDSILGSNESSRALSSIITLVRNELTREDPRFRPVGLLADQDEDHDEQQRKAGAISNITALTKALTAFACLQTATHRRTLRELKMRVVYDCTVVVEGQATFSSSSTPTSPEGSPASSSGFDVTVDSAGKYAGPPAPPRVPRLSRKSSRSTVSARTRESSSTTTTMSGATSGSEIITDVRGELEARAVRALGSQPSSASHSRRASGMFALGGSGFTCLASSAQDPVEPSLAVDAVELLDTRSEEEIVSELENLCGGAVKPSHRRVTSRDGGYDGDAEAIFITADELDSESEGEYDDADELMSDGVGRADGEVVPEVQAALREIDARYAVRDKDRAPSFSSGASTIRGVARPRSKRGKPVVRADAAAPFSYEIEVEETTTTTTTTVRTVEEVPAAGSREEEEEDRARIYRRPRMPGTLRLASSSPASPTDADNDERDERVRYESDATAAGARLDEVGEWVEVGSSATRSASSHHGELSVDSDVDVSSEDGLEATARIPSAPNGEVKSAGSRWSNLAGLSRQEALEHPEESKQRLQVVLSTMTKKFIQRRRTIRRVVSSSGFSSSTSASRSTSRSPALGVSKKRRWPRTSSRTASFSSTIRPDDELPVAPPSPVLSSASSPKSRTKRVFRTLTRGWRGEREPSTPPNSEASTAVSSDVEAADANESGYFDAGLDPSARAAPSTSSDPPTPRSTSAPTRAALSPTPTPPPPPVPPKHGVRHAASVQTMRSTFTTTCRTASSPTEEPEPKSSNFPHAHLVSNLQHFARYSSAAYGQSFLRILGIAKHEFKFPHTEIHANNHAFAHHVGIHVEDILLSSFTDPTPAFDSEKMSPIVNYVAVDHSIKAIVLACRGSLGLSDILTDLTCSYEPIPVPDADPSGSYLVHSGMFCSATVLQRGTVHDVIRDALKQFPDYGLVLCGHSLGGGVASLLSILWSTPSTAFERYAQAVEAQSGHHLVHPPLSTPFVTSASSGLPPGRPISCYTYGVPCVASVDLGAYCHGLVISTVHNYDLVPTLSLGVLRDFKAMAMGFYAEQGVSEEIVGRVIGLCQRRFMARRAARKAAGSSSSPAPAPFPGASDDGSESCGPESLTDPAEESRLVPLSNDEISAGRGSNKALEPAYQDPGLLGHDLVADDLELSNWLWSLRTTIRASSDNEKLYPPGSVYVIESYTVFISGESSSSGQYSRREGRRVLLRAVDDIERRFSEPIFSRTMLSDHSPREYEINTDYLASAVV